MSDITVSIPAQEMTVTLAGEQGPAGPAVPAGSNTRVLYSKEPGVGTHVGFTFNEATGALTLTGAANLGSVSVTGNASVGGTLTAAGAATIASLGVTGAATVGGTLGVTGNTSLNAVSAGAVSAISVTTTGNVVVGGTLSSTGNASVGGTLGVSGAATLSSSLSAGASTLASLGVTGAATVGTTLGVTGATTLSSTLSAGASTLASLGVTGAATVGTTLGVTGATTLSTLSATNGTFSGTLGVTGATTLGTSTTLGGGLFFSAETFDIGTNVGSRPRDIWIARNLNAVGTLTIGGTSTLTGTVSAGVVNTSGLLTANSLSVSTTAAIPTISGNLSIKNGATGLGLFLYNTETGGGVNFERLNVAWSSNTLFLNTTKAGTGVSRDMSIGSDGVGNLNLMTSALNRWQVNGSTGHMLCGADNTYDVGASGSSRPRTIYAATSVLSPTVGTVSGGMTLAAQNFLFACNGTNRWGFTTTGNLTAINDNANDLGEPTQRPRFVYSGTAFVGPGLQFPATQVPSADPNTLDDYEEGTYTPTLTFGTASTGITYATRSGSYVKIGNMVWYRFTIALSSKGTATGNTDVSLPFNTSVASHHMAVYTASMSGVTGPVFAQAPSVNFGGSHTSIVSQGAVLQHSHFTDSSTISVSGCYSIT